MGRAASHLPPHAGQCLRLALAARVSRHPARAERTLPPALDPAQHREIAQCRSRTRRDRACGSQARCRRRRRGAVEAFPNDDAPGRTCDAQTIGDRRHRLIENSNPNKKIKGNVTMSFTRRPLLTTMAAAALLGTSIMAQAADTVRIGVPTKPYWPNPIGETAVKQKLFEKEGITAELTIYRGGAETFEAMAAGAADLILDATSLAAAGRKKGVMSKVVANAAMGYYGWQLMVLAKSTAEVKDLNTKKVAITSAGSGSDLLALWTIQGKKIDVTRAPVGGGGLVPNLLAGNVEAAVVYSPLWRPAAARRRAPRSRGHRHRGADRVCARRSLRHPDRIFYRG